MKAPLRRDLRHRQNFMIHEEEVRLHKVFKINNSLKLSGWARQKLDRFPKASFKNRCLVTNRGKAVQRRFKLSRQEFKRWVRDSKLPGIGPK